MPSSPPPSPIAARRAARPVAHVEAFLPPPFVPTRARPVRVRYRKLRADTRILPHSHDWAQVALSAYGVLRLDVPTGTYIVPPHRAVWVPPGVEHAVTMVEDADLRTLYLYQPAGQCGPSVARHERAVWQQCRVLEASDLLRALAREMPTEPDDGPPPDAETLRRERHLSALILDELRRANPVKLGVDLPHDKRLRTLCEAVIADPTLHGTLADWARNTGASPRTVARLFRDELGSTFTQWRQQVVLAKALSLAATRMPMARIATELGYSPSAFSAMVRKSVGESPGGSLVRCERAPRGHHSVFASASIWLAQMPQPS
ncbi:AraC family transcriptional regulator [Diaphorobacter aerolatus]|uniref:Helix-turn-helix transcriptional regulator n=1 Tax=Diaphorobacter aerolatus TaxID=1288495 RepID=A0A7H0GG49_9BURK|nr:helix-turn-helix transcriptional regulator [Diaphorobacter aerolatus]QNP47265.1 helix-turn-helix transcriptional regulator [Diaphorobacter aerolatus]